MCGNLNEVLEAQSFALITSCYGNNKSPIAANDPFLWLSFFTQNLIYFAPFDP